MAINYSSLLRLPKPDAGTQTWATYFHRLADIMDKFAGDVATVTEKTGTKTLTDTDATADNAKALVITCAQVLTGNLTVVVPTRKRFYLVYNNTTGAFTMTVKTSGGSGVAIKQGRFQFVWCDGTNVVAVSRLSGLTTATELTSGIITATNGLISANTIITSMIADLAVSKAKLLGATGGAGVIRYTGTGSGNTWLDLVRGSANQVLAMTTAVNRLPAWKTPTHRAIATSTQMTYTNGSTTTFTHGLTGIANKYDYKDIRIILVCLTTDLGYSAGDVVYPTQMYGAAGSSDFGMLPIADSTSSIKILVCTNGAELPNKSTRNWGVMTASKWAMIVEVFV